MMLNFKKISILGLAEAVVLSSLICCCFTDVVVAQQPAPSCHQTSQNTQPMDTNEECNCDQSLATLKEVSTHKDLLPKYTAVYFDHSLDGQLILASKSEAYQAPPLIYDFSPIYIKHSSLRI